MRFAVAVFCALSTPVLNAQEHQMSTPVDDDFKLPPALELDRIITFQEAEKVSSLSADAWKRNHPDKIVELSPRRRGIRLRDALMLAKTSR
jgi:hypothetical protein